jgi:NAD-dependent SIR2 family protein deacetylase
MRVTDLCQKAHHNDDRLVALHGSLFRVCCENKDCVYEFSNQTLEPTVPGLKMHPSHTVESAVASLSLQAADVPSCPSCLSSKLRPGICWSGEEFHSNAWSRIERWLQDAANVELVLVIGTEHTPFAVDALEKGADLAWLNIFPSDLAEAKDGWYVGGCVSQTLPYLVDAVLR